LSNLWKTFQTGVGYKQTAISGAVAFVVAVVYFIAQHFAITSLLAVPHWAVASVTFFVLLFGFTLMYADQQRQELAPRIELSADPERGAVVVTPMFDFTRHDDGRVTAVERNAVSIRVLVRATTTVAPKKAAAFLTKFQRQRIGGAWEASRHYEFIQLNWAGSETHEVDLSNKFPRFVNVLIARDDRNRIEVWKADLPLSLRNFFDAQNTYRLTVSVLVDGLTSDITFDVVWKGQWDTIEVRPVREASTT
jgi:hypothetical protein